MIINCNFYSYISYYLLLIPISTLDYPTYLGTFSISATRVGRAAANESPQMDSSDSQAVEDITNQNIVPSITPVPVVYPPNKVLWFHSIKMYSGAQLQRTTWTNSYQHRTCQSHRWTHQIRYESDHSTPHWGLSTSTVVHSECLARVGRATVISRIGKQTDVLKNPKVLRLSACVFRASSARG